mgnify:FL=1
MNDLNSDGDVTATVPHPVRLADLPQRKTTRVVLEPNAGQCAAIAEALGLSALRKLRFVVELTPQRGVDWRLTGKLGATVEQPCRVSFAPVITRIEDEVARHYVSNWQDVTEAEAEMPDDDTVEPLPAVVDVGSVMEEALALLVPAYPRAEGVEDLDLSAAPPGAAPLTEDTVKPFAGLAALKAQMEADAPADESDGS